MDEYAARFAIGGLSPGPARRHLSRSRVALTREITETLRRRDPHRNVTLNRPIFSTYGVSWDFSLSEHGGSLYTILACLCDPEGAGYSIGTPDTLITVPAHVELSDGSLWKLSNGILRDWQITLAARGLVKMTTAWEFGKLEAAAFPAAFTEETGSYGAGERAEITLGGISTPVFDGTISFMRDARPAGFDLDGAALGRRGKIAVDVLGRLTVRMDTTNGLTAFRSSFETDLSFTLRAGALTLGIAIPRAVFQTTSRRVVSSSSADYSVDFLALKDPSAPLCTFTLTE